MRISNNEHVSGKEIRNILAHNAACYSLDGGRSRPITTEAPQIPDSMVFKASVYVAVDQFGSSADPIFRREVVSFRHQNDQGDLIIRIATGSVSFCYDNPIAIAADIKTEH